MKRGVEIKGQFAFININDDNQEILDELRKRLGVPNNINQFKFIGSNHPKQISNLKPLATSTPSSNSITAKTENTENKQAQMKPEVSQPQEQEPIKNQPAHAPPPIKTEIKPEVAPIKIEHNQPKPIPTEHNQTKPEPSEQVPTKLFENEQKGGDDTYFNYEKLTPTNFATRIPESAKIALSLSKEFRTIDIGGEVIEIKNYKLKDVMVKTPYREEEKKKEILKKFELYINNMSKDDIPPRALFYKLTPRQRLALRYINRTLEEPFTEPFDEGLIIDNLTKPMMILFQSGESEKTPEDCTTEVGEIDYFRAMFLIDIFCPDDKLACRGSFCKAIPMVYPLAVPAVVHALFTPIPERGVVKISCANLESKELLLKAVQALIMVKACCGQITKDISPEEAAKIGFNIGISVFVAPGQLGAAPRILDQRKQLEEEFKKLGGSQLVNA